jgi:hypothetical protein
MLRRYLQTSGLVVFTACTIQAAWAAECQVAVKSWGVVDQSDFGDAPEDDDRFGATFARGDFNGDGVVDVVIAAPGEDVPSPFGWSLVDAGLINVRYGGSGDLQVIKQSSIPMQYVMENALFGANLAAGDFNKDGKDDLVVSTAIATGNSGMGRYFIVPGSDSGLDPSKAVVIPGLEAPIHGPIAVGNFNSDLADDLVIGQPEYRYACSAAAGAEGRVVVVLGKEGTGMVVGPRIPYSQNVCGSQFGFAVAAGEKAGQPRVLVGAPTSDYRGLPDTGSVTILKFDAQGQPILMTTWNGGKQNAKLGYSIGVADLNGDGAQDFVMGAPGTGLPDDPGYVIAFNSFSFVQKRTITGGPSFGSALSVGDFNGDHVDDVAVGEPLAGDAQSGAVTLLFGSRIDFIDAGTPALTYAPLDQPPSAGAQFGAALLPVDLDNDNRSELMIGAPRGQLSTSAVGRVHHVQVTATCPAQISSREAR